MRNLQSPLPAQSLNVFSPRRDFANHSAAKWTLRSGVAPGSEAEDAEIAQPGRTATYTRNQV